MNRKYHADSRRFWDNHLNENEAREARILAKERRLPWKMVYQSLIKERSRIQEEFNQIQRTVVIIRFLGYEQDKLDAHPFPITFFKTQQLVKDIKHLCQNQKT